MLLYVRLHKWLITYLSSASAIVFKFYVLFLLVTLLTFEH